MNTKLLPKIETTANRQVARIVPLRSIVKKKIKENIKAGQEKGKKETILFDTKPIFKANKYEFF